MSNHDGLKAAEQAAAEHGGSFTTGTSPVYEATLKRLAATEPIRGLLAHEETPEEAHQRFTAAAAPFLGCKPPKDLRQRMQRAQTVRALMGPVAPLPDSFDLDSLGTVTDIRYQMSCGSCWDHSAVATIEGATIAAGLADKSLDLSEQEVLSCGQNGGCNGDWPETTFIYAKERGLPTETQVPYRASSGNGQCYSGSPFVKIDGYMYLHASDSVASDDEIKAALMQYKCPVSVAVVVDNPWMAYAGGVYNRNNNNPNQINHAVNITAWKMVNGKTVWKVRNHWAKTWGEQGYMWTYTGCNLIGFGAAVCWVKPKTPPVPPPPIPPVPPTPTVGFSGTLVYAGGVLSSVTPAVTSGDCSGCPPKMPVGWSYEDWRRLFADVYEIVQGSDARTVEDAILQVYADIRDRKYGLAIAVALGSWPAVQKLIESVKAMIAKYKGGGVQGSFAEFLGRNSWHLVELAGMI